ncbi:hypothetical protein [Amycolatopsis pigmentata]|uniref:DUF5666 domain-containing protein n=1 Tax=Amycolatopsis pigmentata TaxID=450801 RepID=A0ABW5FNJ2_9PSEU
MRMRVLVAVLATGGALLATGVVTGATAEASGRPCGGAVTTQGVGTDGTPWALKSMYDDNGPGLVAGEEFQIETHEAGQHWTVVLSDNGVPFFTDNDDVSTASGINETHPNHVRHGTINVMSAHAVRHDTGEVIDGSVTLPAAAAGCAPHSP